MIRYLVCAIWGSHSGVVEDSNCQWCDALSVGEWHSATPRWLKSSDINLTDRYSLTQNINPFHMTD